MTSGLSVCQQLGERLASAGSGKKKKKYRNDVFSENMFCAGSPTLKHDVCRGDARGVFAMRDKKNDRWVATGIVTWGIGCGEGYGFYTNVLKYVDWIKKVMEA